MSRAAKLTLMGTSLFALSTVVFVHYTQKAEQVVRLFPFLIYFQASTQQQHSFHPSIQPPTTQQPSQSYHTNNKLFTTSPTHPQPNNTKPNHPQKKQH